MLATHHTVSLSLRPDSRAPLARSRAGASSSRSNRRRCLALPVEASASGGAGEVGNKAVKTAGVFLGAAALVALGSATGFVDPAIAIEGIEGEPNLLSDFYVSFFGEKIDHKVIVEWVVVGQTIGFIGSLVGGWSARDRKNEVERLNNKLLAVNKQLREQARAAKSPSAAALVLSSSGASKSGGGGVALAESPLAEELLRVLRSGKGHLKMRDSVTAKTEFENALRLARSGVHGLESPWKAERKALRGLGAANQQLGDFPKALDAMMEVLKISEKMEDHSGIADAIGVIADIYTDKGDLDKAAQWYDRYIGAMSSP